MLNDLVPGLKSVSWKKKMKEMLKAFRQHPTLVPDLVLDGVNVEGEDADSLAGPPAVTKEAAN